MLNDVMEFTLVRMDDGSESEFKIRKMTITDKSAVDEWLRILYIQTAMKEGVSIVDAEEQVAGLDCAINQWFVSNEKLHARLFWQVSGTNISWKDFFKSFFDTPIATDSDNEYMNRFKKNIMTVAEAIQWCSTNPTKSAKAETKTTKQAKSN